MILLSPIFISSQIVLERSNIDHYSRSRASSLTRRFVYCSGRNWSFKSILNRIMMYFQAYPRTVLYRLLISNSKKCLRARKVSIMHHHYSKSYGSSFWRRFDNFFLTIWRSRYACATPHCTMKINQGYY